MFYLMQYFQILFMPRQSTDLTLVELIMGQIIYVNELSLAKKTGTDNPEMCMLRNAIQASNTLYIPSPVISLPLFRRDRQLHDPKNPSDFYMNHHHHHVVLVARISLTLSRHSSLSFIALGRSSGQHPLSSHNCWMYVRAGCPAFAQPCVGAHYEFVPASPAVSCMSG